MTNFLFPDSTPGSFSISHQDWSLHRKGPADQQRHQEKIKEAVRKNLGQIVSEESIILSDGQKTIKVPIRSLEEYRFRFDYSSGKHSGAGDGDSQVGIIASETASSVTLRMALGMEVTIPRSDIKALRSAGLSMMPEGLEEGLKAQDFANLMEYVITAK